MQIRLIQSCYPELRSVQFRPETPTNIFDFDALFACDLPDGRFSIAKIVESRTGIVGFAAAWRLASLAVVNESNEMAISKDKKVVNEEFASKLLFDSRTMIRRRVSESLGGLSQSMMIRIASLEINIEAEHCVLIPNSWIKFKESSETSLIVGDSFYTRADIFEIFRRVEKNFPGYSGTLSSKQIILSNGGRRQKWIIPTLETIFRRSSRFNIIEAVRRDVETSRIQQILFSTNGGCLEPLKFATRVRRFSLINPVSDSQSEERALFNFHANITLPALWSFVIDIARILNAETRFDRVICVSRDAVHTEFYLKLYLKNLLTDKKRTIDIKLFNCSRVVLDPPADSIPSASYIEYFRDTFGPRDKCLVVDLHGSYRTLSAFCIRYIGYVPRMHLCSHVSNPVQVSRISSRITAFMPQYAPWTMEEINAVPFGSLVGWYRGAAVRNPCEYENLFTDVAHRVLIDHAPKFIRAMAGGQDDLFKAIQTPPRSRIIRDLLWLGLQENRVNRTGPASCHHVQHHRRLVSLLDHPPQKLQTISHRRQRGASLIYERLISPFVDHRISEPIRILEVGIKNRETIKAFVDIENYLGRFGKILRSDGVEAAISKLASGEESGGSRYFEIIRDLRSSVTKADSNLWRFVKSDGGIYVIENPSSTSLIDLPADAVQITDLLEESDLPDVESEFIVLRRA